MVRMGESPPPIAAWNLSRMDLVVCLSTSLREVLGLIHKEIRYGVDGYKNRPPALVGVRIHYPRQA